MTSLIQSAPFDRAWCATSELKVSIEIRIFGNSLLIFFKYGNNLFISFLATKGELLVLCGALIGAGIGFLWFNAYPAQIFMGDVGSLSIGAILSSIAILSNSFFILFIISGIFIIESASVILQVSFFKLTRKFFQKGKRIFLMAPLHHHYELKGLKEEKIVENFWKINILLVIFGIVIKITA